MPVKFAATKFVQLTLLAIGMTLPAIAQQADRVSPGAELTERVSLADHQPAWATASRDLGRVSGDTPLAYLRLTLARAPQQEAAFQQLLRDQQDPHSARYHQWWTPETLGAAFGPTPHDLAAVESWLTVQGFAVDRVAHSRMFVVFHGSAAQAEAAFHTQLHYFSTVHGRQIALAAPPQIPAALAPIITSIQGLASRPLHPGVHTKPGYSTCYDHQCYKFVAPADFATIYNLNPIYAGSVTGSGQTIAIVGRAQVWSYDITEFEGDTGVPSATPTLVVPPNGVMPPAPNTSTSDPVNDDQTEATLDVERSYGTAPTATVDLVASLSTQTEDGVDIAKDYVIDDFSTLHASIMTNSFGICEADVSASSIRADDALFQQGAAEGISSIGISGDAGAAGCDSYNSTPPSNQILSPNALCASGYVTCVGGTRFDDSNDLSAYWSSTNSPTLGSALSYIPEGAWNEPLDSDNVSQASASGGGVSGVIATPSWQTGTGVPGTAGRYTPDIAFTAAEHDAYYGCYAAGAGNCGENYFEYFFGTSAGAPSMAGIVALLDQKLGGAQGNLNPTLYLLAALDGSTVYHDTTIATSGVINCSLTLPSMCNNSTPGPVGLNGGLSGYELATGFDLVTGWGSINAANLLGDWSSAAPTSTTTTLTVAPSTSFAAGTTATLSATVTASSGTPAGSVTFVTDGFVIGTASLKSGTASVTANTRGIAPGKYPVVAQYSGAAADSPSNSTSVTVTVTKAASAINLTASPTTVTPPAKVTLSATVSSPDGTPAGTVNFYYGSLSLGSASLAGGKASLAEGTGGIPAGTYGIHAVYNGNSSISGSTSATVDVKVQ
jgi:subtilase family serine protease